MNNSIRPNLTKISQMIPSRFKLIQWLDTRSTMTSSAYINTEINGLDGRTSRIEIDACWKNTDNLGWIVLFGAQESDNDSGTIIVRVDGSSESSLENPFLCANLNDYATIQVYNNTPFHLVLDKDKFRIEKNEVSTTCGTTQSLAPLYIGTAKSCMTPGVEWLNYRRWQGLVGRCTIFDNERLVGDFIPVKQIENQICGYYDIITEKFFQSIGEVPFMEGAI